MATTWRSLVLCVGVVVWSPPNAIAAVELDAVDVTAAVTDTSAETLKRSTPGQVNVVDKKEFNQRQVSNNSEALRYVPGVMANSDSGGVGEKISIRGSNLNSISYDNGGVVMQQDGLPVSSADGANHNRLINPYTANQVVVSNGASALASGASALGGSINYVSRTALNSDPNRVYAGGGSFGLYRGGASIGGVSDRFDGILAVDGQHYNGFRHHSRERVRTVQGNVGWQVSERVNLRFYGTHVNSQQELAGALTQAEFKHNDRQAAASYKEGDHQLNVETNRLAMTGTWEIDDNSELGFGASYEHQSLYHPIVTSPFFSLLIDTEQNTSGAMVRYRHRFQTHRLEVGANFATTTNRGGNYENNAAHRGARTNSIDQRAQDTTVFVLDHWQLSSRWTLVSGVQGVVTQRNARNRDLASDNTRHQKKTYSTLNPRVGVIYALSGNSEAFANVSRLYQAPNNFELDNDLRGDDSTLKAMHGVEYELGTRGHYDMPASEGTWGWGLSTYYARIKNEILSFGDPGNPDMANFDRTTHAGIEALLEANIALGSSGKHRFAPRISMTVNRFRFRGDEQYGNNNLPAAPRYQVHGEALYRHPASGFYIGPTFDFVGARYADMANTYRVGSYELVGLRSGVERPGWDLFVEATNLGNRHFISTLSPTTQADADARVLNPGMPRAVFAGVNVHY